MPAWTLVLIFMARLSRTLTDRQDAGLELGLDLHGCVLFAARLRAGAHRRSEAGLDLGLDLHWMISSSSE